MLSWLRSGTEPAGATRPPGIRVLTAHTPAHPHNVGELVRQITILARASASGGSRRDPLPTLRRPRRLAPIEVLGLIIITIGPCSLGLESNPVMIHVRR